MIFLATNTFCPTSDALMQILQKRNISVFRYNTDMFYKYCFSWNSEGFIFRDPCNRSINSKEISHVIFFKALLSPADSCSFDQYYGDNAAYVKNTLNYITNGISIWAAEKSMIKLWPLREYKYPKMRQMKIASKYFQVPKSLIYWGNVQPHVERLFKTLTPLITKDKCYAYVDKCFLDQLDPTYPWFTQDISKGKRDATIVYINGHIHCYQFATERGNLTDWRVTQGTEKNKWIPWDSSTEFNQKIHAYMHELGLKFGRLDFIIGEKEPQFLEVNPCGQFGWLDDEKLTLHNEVADAILDPSSAVEI